MTELMHDHGHSFRSLAHAVKSDPGYLNKIANGARPAPMPSLARAIDRELRADDELVELAHREHAPPAPTGPHPMDDADAANVRATLHHLVALDTLQGSEGLTTLAVRSFRNAADRLAVVGGTADVRSAVADLGVAASWIAADAVEREQSKVIALESLVLADMANDTRLHRFLISHLSMLSEHAGRYAEALAFAEQLLAENPNNPRVQAMIQVRRARALSGLGAHAEALDAWDHAKHLLTASPSADDGLTYWIYDSEMALHKAVILTRGGDRTAVEWGQRGVEGVPPSQGRDQVLYRAILLHSAVAAHAWREVPAIVENLLQHAGLGRSARVPELLEQVWTSVQGQHAPVTVRDAVRAAYETFK